MPEPVAPKDRHYWTSAEVARAFRVGVSSVKRWTDEGELEATRTHGGHRRYSLPALYRFASIRNFATSLLPPLEQNELFHPLPAPSESTLLEALIAGDSERVRRLVTPHATSVIQRATFLDRVVGDALRKIGEQWERGELGVYEEHRASNLLVEALEPLRPNIRPYGRLALLACPPGEQHDLPLRLVRLIFEWSGWQTEFLGAQLPWDAARHAVDARSPALLAFSARSREPFTDTEFIDLVHDCADRGTRVITGGEWARGGGGGQNSYLRFRTLRGFEKWLRGESLITSAA